MHTGPRFFRFVVAFSVLLTMSFRAAKAADPSALKREATMVNLSPRCKVGDLWKVSWEGASFTGTGDARKPSQKDSGVVQVKVLEAADGRWTRLDLAFGKCESDSASTGLQKSDLNASHLIVTRAVDPKTHQAIVNATVAGNDAQQASASSLSWVKILFGASLVPSQPVSVGDTWQTSHGDAFGLEGGVGTVTLKLDREETQNGKHVGVITIDGPIQATIGYGKTNVDLTGTIQIDTDTGMVQSIQVNGGSDRNGYKGEFTYNLVAAVAAPVMNIDGN